MCYHIKNKLPFSTYKLIWSWNVTNSNQNLCCGSLAYLILYVHKYIQQINFKIVVCAPFKASLTIFVSAILLKNTLPCLCAQ